MVRLSDRRAKAKLSDVQIGSIFLCPFAMSPYTHPQQKSERTEKRYYTTNVHKERTGICGKVWSSENEREVDADAQQHTQGTGMAWVGRASHMHQIRTNTAATTLSQFGQLRGRSTFSPVFLSLWLDLDYRLTSVLTGISQSLPRHDHDTLYLV